MTINSKNHPDEAGKCIIWNNHCENSSNCTFTNKKVIEALLDLKKDYNKNNYSDVVNLIIANIKQMLINYNVSAEDRIAFLHYIRNGIGSHLDNSFIDCHGHPKYYELGLKRYLFRILTLNKIYSSLICMSAYKFNVLVQILSERHKNYMLSLSLNRLLKIIKEINSK